MDEKVKEADNQALDLNNILTCKNLKKEFVELHNAKLDFTNKNFNKNEGIIKDDSKSLTGLNIKNNLNSFQGEKNRKKNFSVNYELARNFDSPYEFINRRKHHLFRITEKNEENSNIIINDSSKELIIKHILEKLPTTDRQSIVLKRKTEKLNASGVKLLEKTNDIYESNDDPYYENTKREEELFDYYLRNLMINKDNQGSEHTLQPEIEDNQRKNNIHPNEASYSEVTLCLQQNSPNKAYLQIDNNEMEKKYNLELSNYQFKNLIPIFNSINKKAFELNNNSKLIVFKSKSKEKKDEFDSYFQNNGNSSSSASTDRNRNNINNSEAAANIALETSKKQSFLTKEITNEILKNQLSSDSNKNSIFNRNKFNGCENADDETNLNNINNQASGSLSYKDSFKNGVNISGLIYYSPSYSRNIKVEAESFKDYNQSSKDLDSEFYTYRNSSSKTFKIKSKYKIEEKEKSFFNKKEEEKSNESNFQAKISNYKSNTNEKNTKILQSSIFSKLKFPKITTRNIILGRNSLQEIQKNIVFLNYKQEDQQTFKVFESFYTDEKFYSPQNSKNKEKNFSSLNNNSDIMINKKNKNHINNFNSNIFSPQLISNSAISIPEIDKISGYSSNRKQNKKK